MIRWPNVWHRQVTWVHASTQFRRIGADKLRRRAIAQALDSMRQFGFVEYGEGGMGHVITELGRKQVDS